MNITRPTLTPNTLPQLRNGRVHEVCGPAAHSFAAAICSDNKGMVVWIDEVLNRERILPAGFMRFCNPGRVIFVRGGNHMDVLWAAEECLRAKAVPLVITRLSKPLDFTQGRRLQLAAETGKSLGLFLVPEGSGSNAAETRWHCTPHFAANGFEPDDSTLQHWRIIKNKTGTLKSWIVDWDEQAHRIIVVSKTGERSDFARAAH